MSTSQKRLAVFRQLPLRAQLAMINSSKASETLNKNSEYITSLEQIHTECLANATPEAKSAYDKAKDLLK